MRRADGDHVPTPRTHQAPHHPPAPRPTAPSGPFGGLWLLAALLVAGVVAVSGVGAAIVLASGSSNDATADSTGPAGSEPDPSTAADDRTLASDAETVVHAFAGAWELGDWEGMAHLSTDSIVTIARDWHVDGHHVEVVTPLTDRGTELLVTDPQGGSALIFTLVVDTASRSPTIVDLAFSGDAG